MSVRKKQSIKNSLQSPGEVSVKGRFVMGATEFVRKLRGSARKKSECRAGMMAQGLKALAAFPEDLGLVPSIYTVGHSYL